MKLRCIHLAGQPDGGNLLAGVDDVAFPHHYVTEMGIGGDDPAFMLDKDKSAE